MSPTAAPYQLFVGVDIAAASATVTWTGDHPAPRRPFTIEQSSAGYQRLLDRLAATGLAPDQVLVVLEATSTYWIRLACALHAAGYAVSVVNPKQAHDFAKALLQRAKTDPLDAAVLAQLGAKLTPARWTPPPAVYQEFQQRLAERDSLLGLRQQILNQHHALLHEQQTVPSVLRRQQDLVVTIDEQLAAVEAELTTLVAADSAWAASVRLLQTIPGVGLITAAWGVVATLNFTSCPDAERATAYAGLAPQPRQSGTSVRGRAAIGRTGDARLRTALYMASLTAARYNPAVKALYERLRAAGKPVKVARCAAARKLLHQIWAIGTTQRSFDPQYHTRLVGPST
jgi:transposase